MAGRAQHPGIAPHTEELILAWADAQHERTGTWPTKLDGELPEAPGEKWSAIDQHLHAGGRGLPGGTSLAQLIARRRGVRNQAAISDFTEAQILAWADAHHERTGRWPVAETGTIPEAPAENWRRVDNALRYGLRGLPGGSSLAQLIADRRGVRNQTSTPRLTEEQILAWADVHRQRIGKWPGKNDGAVTDAPGETWGTIDCQLREGGRGLPGGLSLAHLIAQQRGVRNRTNLPAFTEAQILAWADSYRSRTGHWPTRRSGAIAEAEEVNWQQVHDALMLGLRGRAGGSSLAKLLDQHRRKLTLGEKEKQQCGEAVARDVEKQVTP